MLLWEGRGDIFLLWSTFVGQLVWFPAPFHQLQCVFSEQCICCCRRNNELKLKVRARAILTFPVSTDKNKRRHLLDYFTSISSDLVQNKLISVSCFIATIFFIFMLLLNSRIWIDLQLCSINELNDLVLQLFTSVPCDLLFA